MRSGELRQRVTIQVNTPAANSMGELVDTWSEWAEVWGAVEPNNGRRYFEALQANADVSGVCRIRYRAGILPTMRLLLGTRVMQIATVIDPDERHRELHLLYKELKD